MPANTHLKTILTDINRILSKQRKKQGKTKWVFGWDVSWGLIPLFMPEVQEH